MSERPARVTISYKHSIKQKTGSKLIRISTRIPKYIIEQDIIRILYNIWNMEQAVEYKRATVKLDNALAKLKSELVGLRNQDAKLMKSLITINDSIRRISPKTRRRISKSTFLYGNGTKKFVGVHLLPMETVAEKTHLVRRQSEPNFYKMNKANSGSLSSVEDIHSSTEDCSSISGESDDGASSSGEADDYSIRPRSNTMSRVENDISSDDRRYEEILRLNVRLWKCSRSRD